MFLHLSVILFTGGVCIPACTGADTPWADISQHALRQTPLLGRHVPACTGADTPEQTYPSMHWGRHPPPGQTATAADGTHPTGMHSC